MTGEEALTNAPIKAARLRQVNHFIISTLQRRELNSPQNKIFKDLKFVDSHKNVLVQLADMVAGAINRSYSDKDGKGLYKGIIAHKIEDEWKFGR